MVQSGNPLKWKTSRKLLFGFGLLITIVALISLVAYQRIQDIDRDVAQVVDVEEPLERAILEMEIQHNILLLWVHWEI